jgi:hypothetical protein
MADKPRQLPTAGQAVLIVVALLVLDVLGGLTITKLNDLRNHIAFENTQCSASDEELSKLDLKKIRFCQTDTDCILVPGQNYGCAPNDTVNREYVCIAKRKYEASEPYHSLKLPPANGVPSFKTMSQITVCVVGPWKPLPHIFPEIKNLFSGPACVQDRCLIQ